YFIQHWPLISSGVSAACCLADGGGAEGALCVARPAGAGGGGGACGAGCTAATCGAGSGVAGERSAELVPPAQSASASRANTEMSLYGILNAIMRLHSAGWDPAPPAHHPCVSRELHARRRSRTGQHRVELALDRRLRLLAGTRERVRGAHRVEC